MADPAIGASGLVKRSGPVAALDGIDLAVQAGSVLGLLGPNGAGTTTAMRILTTILEPDAGQASVLGLDVVRQAEEVRAVIGLAGQYAAIDENLTGRENLNHIVPASSAKGDGRMRAEQNKAAADIRTQDAAVDWSMTGKTVLFTGASRGMGRFAAIELARLGAQILLVGHHQARGAAVAEAIRDTGGSAEFLRADMGDAAEVCALATAVLARRGPVHVLIHSAGGLLPAAARTREGVDRGFAQNFLGAYLLTRLLEERLLDSAPARVIAVGSAAHRLLKSADVDALIRPGTADPRMGSRQRGSYQMRSYQIAKLAVTTWTYGLARRWAGRGVTANVLDPGIVKGKSGSEHFEGPAPMRILMSHVIPFFVAAGMERGSQQYVRLAADPSLASVSGMYFVSGKEKKQSSSPLALDPVVQQRIDDAAEEWAAPFLRGR